MLNKPALKTPPKDSPDTYRDGDADTQRSHHQYKTPHNHYIHPLSTPHGIHSAAINHNHTILADRRPTHHTPHLTTKTDNKTSNTDTENNLHHLIKKQEWWARRDF
jgi:hypothetical protein